MNLSCHCGAVQIALAERPEYLNDCNCSLCKKSGTLWGYFHPEKVSVSGETKFYQRADKDPPIVNQHFCERCGVITHWSLTEAGLQKLNGNHSMGVNMRLCDRTELTGIEIRFPDGAAWSGQGEFGYVKPAEVIE